MFKKKLLAVVVSIALLATSLSGMMLFSQAEDTYGWVSDTDGVVVTGNETDGYEWQGNALVGYSRPLDIATESISFKVDASKTAWVNLRLTSDYDAMGVQNRLNGDNGMNFIMEPRDSGQSLFMYELSSSNVVYGGAFDWSVPHTYGFVKIDNKWYFHVDGLVGGSVDGSDFTEKINQLQKAGGLYLQLTCQAVDTESAAFSGIRIVENEKWIYSDNFSGTVTGDNDNGFNIDMNSGSTLFFNKEVDLSTVAIELDSSVVNNTSNISFSNKTGKNYPGWGQGYGVDLMLNMGESKEGTGTWHFRCDYGGAGVPNVCNMYVGSMNISKKVILDFRMVDNSWHLFVNGERAGNAFDAQFKAMDTQHLRIYLSNFNGGKFEGKGIRILEKNSDWTVTENANGVAVSETGGLTKLGLNSGVSVVAYNQPINLQDAIVFRPAHPSAGWTSLQFAPTTENAGAYGSLYNSNSSTGGVQLLFQEDSSNPGALNLFYWGEGGPVYLATGVRDFDWNALHTVEIVSAGNEYYFALDGRVYDKYGDNNLDIAAYITPLLGGNTYLRCASSLNGNSPSDVLIGVKPSDTVWYTNGTVAISGNEESGYSWTGTPTVSYSRPINLDTQEVTMSLGITPGTTVGFTLSGSCINPAAAGVNNYSFYIEHRANDDARLIMSYPNEIFDLYLGDYTFDFSQPHTYGLTRVDGKWRFTLDGNVVGEARSELTDCIQSVLDAEGNAYISFFHHAGGTPTFNNVKITDKPAPKAPVANLGGQVRGDVNTQGDTALRFAFDLTATGVEYEDREPLNSGNYKRDLTGATVTIGGVAYPLKDFGAILSLHSDSLTKEAVAAATDGKTVDIPAANLYEISEDGGTVRYTAVITNVPADKHETPIYARPYVTYQNGDNQITVYGDVINRNVAQYATNNPADPE